MTNRWLYIFAGCLVFWSAVPASPQNDRRTVAVVYEEPRQHIGDFSLVERLCDWLALYGGMSIIVPDEDSTLPEAPRARFHLDRLVEWGRETGSRYVIYLQVHGRRLTTKKQFSIPFLLSRYVVEGCLEGVYCLIDVTRNKLVRTWDLRAKVSGPRQWQPADDYREDPDLHIPAPQKIVFLQRLEARAVEQMAANIRPHLKGR